MFTRKEGARRVSNPSASLQASNRCGKEGMACGIILMKAVRTIVDAKF